IAAEEVKRQVKPQVKLTVVKPGEKPEEKHEEKHEEEPEEEPEEKPEGKAMGERHVDFVRGSWSLKGQPVIVTVASHSQQLPDSALKDSGLAGVSERWKKSLAGVSASLIAAKGGPMIQAMMMARDRNIMRQEPAAPSPGESMPINVSRIDSFKN